MTTRPRTRKRVLAICRASDGSAFQKCIKCGVSVAIALFDMHECESKMADNSSRKRFRGMIGLRSLPKTNPRYSDQPISPYRLFMETFMKGREMENPIELDRLGFEKWKNMSNEEKYPYAFHARMVDSYHQETLNKEAREMRKVNDEADSAMVGKIDKFHWIYEESSDYESETETETESESETESSES